MSELERPSYTVSSRSGAITVVTTEAGLPLDVRVEADQLSRRPDDLAADVLRLCKRAADRAAAARRCELAAAGVDPDLLALAGLPDLAEVARREQAEDEEEMEDRSWLRPL